MALTLFKESLRVDKQYSKLREKNPKTTQAIQWANQLVDIEEVVKQKKGSRKGRRLGDSGQTILAVTSWRQSSLPGQICIDYRID